MSLDKNVFDIRNDEPAYNAIRWCDNNELDITIDGVVIKVPEVLFYIRREEEIDSLIEALQKAKELWGEV